MITLQKLTENDLDILHKIIRHQKQVLELHKTNKNNMNTLIQLSICKNLMKQTIKKAISLPSRKLTVFQLEEHHALVLVSAIMNFMPFLYEEQKPKIESIQFEIINQLDPFVYEEVVA